MITSIRKNINIKFINKIFIIFFILASLGVFSLPFLFKKNTGAPWTLRVNGQEISTLVFMQEVEQQRNNIIQFKRQYGQYADFLFQSMGISADPRFLATDRLTKKVILKQLADKAGIIISSEFVQESMQSKEFVEKYLSDTVPLFIFDGNNVDQKVLRDYLRSRKISIDTLIESVTDAIKVQLLSTFIKTSLYIPDFEMNTFINTRYAPKKYSVVTIDYKKCLQEATKQNVTDEQLTTFFNDQNKESQRYFAPEKRTGIVWKLEPKNYPISVSSDSIASYYEKNKDKKYVEKPALIEIRQIVYYNDSTKKDRPELFKVQEDLKKNSDSFSHYATLYSDDKESAKKGGLLAPFERGTHKEKIEKAAFGLTQPGTLSDIIPIENGFALIQLVKKTPRSYMSLKKATPDIQKELTQEAFKKEFNIEVKKISKQKNIDLDQLKNIMAERAIPMETVSSKSIQNNASLLQSLFKINKIHGLDSYTDDTGSYIVMLISITKKKSRSLNKVKPQIKDDYYEYKARSLVQEKVQSIRTTLQTHRLADIARTPYMVLDTIDWIKSSSEKEIALLEKKDIPVEKILQLETVDSIHIHVGAHDSKIIQLDAIEKVDQSSLAQDKITEFTRHKNEFQSILIEGVIASLYKNATIEVNQSPNQLSENYSL